MDVLRQWDRRYRKVVWPVDSTKREESDETWMYRFTSPSVLDDVVGVYIDNGCFTRDPNGGRYCYLHIQELPGETFQETGTVGALRAIAKIRTITDPSLYPPPYVHQPDLSVLKPPRRLAGPLHISFQDNKGDTYKMGEHDFNLCIYVLDDSAEHQLNMRSMILHQDENDRGPEAMREVVNGQRQALEMGGTFPEVASSGMTAYDTGQQETSQGRAPPILPRLDPGVEAPNDAWRYTFPPPMRYNGHVG